jgi:hypothetical protein
MYSYTTEEILERLKKLTGDRFDNDLAIRLSVSKQSFAQYKHKKVIDIQQKIIHLLLEKIDATEVRGARELEQIIGQEDTNHK